MSIGKVVFGNQYEAGKQPRPASGVPVFPKPLSPCERDGHDYKVLFEYRIDVSSGHYTFFCTKCLKLEKVKV
jgi:hypothetical protein